VGEYIEGVLNQIGYKASLKPLSQNIEFNYIQNTNNKVQISVTQWFQDYPARLGLPQGASQLTAVSTRAATTAINISGLCDKAIDTQEATAETLELTNPTAANSSGVRSTRRS